MLPPKQALDPFERELLALLRRLGDSQKTSLLDFARFLAQQGESLDKGGEERPVEPLDLPRPENEKVVAAIRRLAQNYPMLNRNALLHETSSLMTAHVMHGRDATEVIDQLEALFHGAYQAHRNKGD